MRDVELYQELLGLVAPWTVGRVELSVEGEQVGIWSEHAPEVRWPCPECEALLPIERLAIDVLKEATVRGATRIPRISWDEAWHLIDCAVKRRLRAKGKSVPARPGVDEKAPSKGARYMGRLDGYFLI